MTPQLATGKGLKRVSRKPKPPSNAEIYNLDMNIHGEVLTVGRQAMHIVALANEVKKNLDRHFQILHARLNAEREAQKDFNNRLYLAVSAQDQRIRELERHVSIIQRTKEPKHYGRESE